MVKSWARIALQSSLLQQRRQRLRVDPEGGSGREMLAVLTQLGVLEESSGRDCLGLRDSVQVWGVRRLEGGVVGVAGGQTCNTTQSGRNREADVAEASSLVSLRHKRAGVATP